MLLADRHSEEEMHVEIGEEEHLEGPVLLRGADLCSALAASAAPHVSSAERAQLVRRLEAEEEAAEEEEEEEEKEKEEKSKRKRKRKKRRNINKERKRNKKRQRKRKSR